MIHAAPMYVFLARYVNTENTTKLRGMPVSSTFNLKQNRLKKELLLLLEKALKKVDGDDFYEDE